ncbi:hypothetical protein JNUCC21_10820 [Bacillus sp. JNUCC-21]
MNPTSTKKQAEDKVQEYHRSLVCDMDRALSYEEESNFRSVIEAVN